MKRVIIILVLLAICVVVGWYCAHYTTEVNEFISGSIARALNALEEGDRDTLTYEVEQLRDFWDREEDHIIHFVRHPQIEEITRSISRLRALNTGESYVDLAAELESIRWEMDHIYRNERMIFSNLF